MVGGPNKKKFPPHGVRKKSEKYIHLSCPLSPGGQTVSKFGGRGRSRDEKSRGKEKGRKDETFFPRLGTAAARRLFPKPISFFFFKKKLFPSSPEGKEKLLPPSPF